VGNLSGDCQYWSNLLALPAACFLLVSLYLRLCLAVLCQCPFRIVTEPPNRRRQERSPQSTFLACKRFHCLLRSWVRIPPGAWMFVCCECCVLSGRALCDGLITRPEESYGLWRVVVCDQETSYARRL